MKLTLQIHLCGINGFNRVLFDVAWFVPRACVLVCVCVCLVTVDEEAKCLGPKLFGCYGRRTKEHFNSVVSQTYFATKPCPLRPWGPTIQIMIMSGSARGNDMAAVCHCGVVFTAWGAATPQSTLYLQRRRPCPKP